MRGLILASSPDVVELRRCESPSCKSVHANLREDEVVLCRFEGFEPAVRRVAERAAIPFERVLEAGHSSWAGKPAALEPEPREDDRDA